MAHLHSIHDTDLHFIIDPISRRITSESGKVSLMRYDHLSERFTFEVPRFIEGHDMSLSEKVEIHYINADKRMSNTGIYEIDDVQLSPDSDDVVIFSWLISQNATSLSGTLNFAVRFVCYSNDEIQYQWFTEPFANIRINESIYNADAVAEEYDIDIVECWKREIIQAFEDSDVYTETKHYRDEAKSSASTALSVERRIEKLLTEISDTGGFNPKGDYDPTATYGPLDIVTYDSVIWLCKKSDVKGVEPSTDKKDTWQLLFEIDTITTDMIDAMEPVEITDEANALITTDEIDTLLGE